MYDDLVRDLRDETYIYHFSRDYLRNIMFAAADAIEELTRNTRELPRWIPVSEKPPLKVGDNGYNGYLVYADGYYEVADYATDKFDNVPYFHVDGEYEPGVTHFMQLPEPPKEDKPHGN